MKQAAPIDEGHMHYRLVTSNEMFVDCSLVTLGCETHQFNPVFAIQILEGVFHTPAWMVKAIRGRLKILRDPGT